MAKRCGKQLRAAEVANRCKTLPRAVKSWTLCSLMFFNYKVSEGTLGPVDYHCRAPFVCVPVQEAGQQHQQLPKPAHQKQRSSNNRSSSQAAYSMSRVAGRPCGHSCQELPRAGNLCFLTRVSEGTLGLVDYHCRASFRPSLPWCFPVREVRFFKAIC